MDLVKTIDEEDNPEDLSEDSASDDEVCDLCDDFFQFDGLCQYLSKDNIKFLNYFAVSANKETCKDF